VPAFILPAPAAVGRALAPHAPLLAIHARTTLAEILLGIGLGTAIGVATAILLAVSGIARRWLMSMLVVSQALPVFALAPLLVLWFGYGLASKVVMAILIIYFPVTATLFDGLRRTEQSWLDLARTMGATRMRILLRLRLPAALPAFGSGLRIATAVAPIGAVVGEWVGSSAGLGYLMLHANGRMQTDLMFAALLTLAILAVALYTAVDAGLRRAMPWQAGEAEEAP
jgi:putative hydroxymethylpyrimidine transport system permease protein